MNKHTPGPWRLNDDIHAYVIGNDYQCIDGGVGFCTAEKKGFSLAGHMKLADARLIAAAPDLLDLAHKFAGECAECNGTGVMNVKTWPGGIEVDGEKPCDQCEDIRAVIAKATDNS